MGETRPRLVIEQEIIEEEANLQDALFWRRFARIVLFVWVPLVIIAIAAGNVLIDFSRPGDGRVALNLPLGVVLLVSIFGGVPFWYQCREGIAAAQMDLLKLGAELNSLEVGVGDNSSTVFRSYRDGVPALRDTYRRGADRYRTRHNRFQIAVIVGSILTSVATTASAQQGVWSWIAVALSALVSISAGVISYFKFRERSMNLQQTADAIDLEIQAYALGIRRYKNLNSQEASSCFAEEIERIKEEQRKKELQLEQPPEAHQDRQQHSSA
ncbi:DUF4231 domain-containing protein [Streptomyces sp. NBC_00356]|uniref:DUF4231 domain-containing protein n=1 Tax=Streptomyces sp. NBC_00356 TaxID=2975724 RepID=UPI002E25F5D4